MNSAAKLGFWVSGFCACGAFANAMQGQWGWTGFQLLLAVANYAMARLNVEAK